MPATMISMRSDPRSIAGGSGPTPSAPRRLVPLLLAALLVLVGCGRIGIAYQAAGLFIGQYAANYVELTPAQRARWEPQVAETIAQHRARELPALTAFVEALRQSAQDGFGPENMRCLRAELHRIYARHAQLAVELAAPLLAALTPAQIAALETRFQQRNAAARLELAGQDAARETRRRARRYLKSIEDWTGPLTETQRTLVAEITGRMPHTATQLIDDRASQQARLLELLRAGAGEPALAGFLTAWLVDLTALPPALRQALSSIETLLDELFIRLGASLSDQQRARLDERLRAVRDDLRRLQNDAALPPLRC